MTWMILGLSAGVLLGFYDFWTKQSMAGNGTIAVVFWSSLFGCLTWSVALSPISSSIGIHVDIDKIDLAEQAVILVKGVMMTLSWMFAYYSVRELPMSFSGAVRASGPLWTMIGGMIIFGEFLTALQLAAVCTSIIAYYILSIVGKQEGIKVLQSKPVLMMLAATILSAVTTVYDKYIVQVLEIPIYTVQAYSALHRFILAALIAIFVYTYDRSVFHIKWSVYVPLVGISWVGAEFIYFFAIADPAANVTYLSIFRRMSLVVGFILSVIFIGEKSIKQKAIVVSLILISTVVLILDM